MFYPLQNTATQVMPALCHLTIDQEKKVRDESFKLLKEFIEKVHRVSENPSVIDEIESELEVSYNNNNKFTNNIASAWATWAVSSFTSKLMSSKATKPSSSANNSSVSSSATNNSSSLDRENMNGNIKKLSQTKANHSMRLERTVPTKQENKDSDLSDYDDAVNDGWSDELDDKTSLSSATTKSLKNENKTDKSGWDVDVEEDILDLKDKPVQNSYSKEKPVHNSYLKEMNTDRQEKKLTQQGDSWSTASTRSISKTAVKTTKSKTLEDELFESLAEPTTRKKRTGAMKLGAKKA